MTSFTVLSNSIHRLVEMSDVLLICSKETRFVRDAEIQPLASLSKLKRLTLVGLPGNSVIGQ